MTDIGEIDSSSWEQSDVNSSSHIFPPTTVIEDLLNCPTMASVSQQGSLEVNIPKELDIKHVTGTLHNTGPVLRWYCKTV